MALRGNTLGSEGNLAEKTVTFRLHDVSDRYIGLGFVNFRLHHFSTSDAARQHTCKFFASDAARLDTWEGKDLKHFSIPLTYPKTQRVF